MLVRCISFLFVLLIIFPCYARTGTASWYGKFHAGKPTASGERFDPHGFTAAHRTLPLGTMVLVTDHRTHESVVVRINDRGPYVKHRLIDLSERAAKSIHMEEKGVDKVTITVLSYSSND